MAVFGSLAEKLQNTLGKLRGRGKLTEQDVKDALREVRLALLEADVNYKVVRDFTARVRERAVGQEVMTSLAPAHQVIKIVHEELTELMGGSQSKLEMASQAPTILMLVGLQGAGKTASCAKLARLLQKQGHRPLLVADVQAGGHQTAQVLGEQLQIRFSACDRKSRISPRQQWSTAGATAMISYCWILQAGSTLMKS